MATWYELGRDSRLAARLLSRADRLRSSVSCAYYAAYSAVAHDMAEQTADFPHGWNNPAHEQIARWLEGNRTLPIRHRRRLVKAVRRLRKAREDADYRPGMSFNKADVIELLRESALVFRLLGLDHESD